MTVSPATLAPALLVAVLLLQLPVLPDLGTLWLLGTGALVVVAVLIRHRARASRIALLALLLLPLRTVYEGSLWERQLLPESCEGQLLTLTARSIGLARFYEQPDGRLWRSRLSIETISPANCRGPRRALVYLPSKLLGELRPEEAEALEPGSRFRITARLRRPWGRVNPESLEGERAYVTRKIHAIGSAHMLRSLPGRDDAPARLNRLRAQLSAWLRAHADERVAPLLAALGVADRRFIAPETWEQLRRYGLTHLMVVSGLHISLAALPGWCLGYLLSRLGNAGEPAGRILPVLLALLGAGAYTLLAGATLPTQRALLMLLFMSLPRLAARSACASRTLSMAVLFILLLDPLALLGASFWLSAGAVALILWLSACSAPRRGLTALPRLQLFLLIAMLPVGLFWFGQASGPGAVLNLVAIPLVSFCALPALLVTLLLATQWETAALQLLDLAGWPLDLLLRLMEFGDSIQPTQAMLELNTMTAVLLLALAGSCLIVLPLGRGALIAGM
ncbi:MAG: ComEC/Rec2 family competence protein, partial [Halieaceae bacterium]|nr:ComEC/Rec2 family competence protein [Halieaceae bacterium]